MNKRGISPLIATVLLVGLTIAVGVTIAIGGTSLINDLTKVFEPGEEQVQQSIISFSPIETKEKIYIYDTAGTIAIEKDDSLTYITKDYLGSTRAVIDSNGNLIYSQDYFPFGKETKENKEDISYSGKEYDEDTGLYYYGARYYNPDTGRFTQIDPVGSSSSPYAAFANSPMVFVDPDGREISKPLNLIGRVRLIEERFGNKYSAPEVANAIAYARWSGFEKAVGVFISKPPQELFDAVEELGLATPENPVDLKRYQNEYMHSEEVDWTHFMAALSAYYTASTSDPITIHEIIFERLAKGAGTTERWGLGWAISNENYPEEELGSEFARAWWFTIGGDVLQGIKYGRGENDLPDQLRGDILGLQAVETISKNPNIPLSKLLENSDLWSVRYKSYKESEYFKMNKKVFSGFVKWFSNNFM
jgi:RHS repeat-associated protein/flagellin-like protein